MMNLFHYENERSTRIEELIAGVGAFCMAIFLFSGLPWVVRSGLSGDHSLGRWSSFLGLLIVVVAIGLGLLIWSWRLIWRRPRSDNGLMSPKFLVLFGITLSIVVVFAVFDQPSFIDDAVSMWQISLGAIALGYLRHRARKR